MENQARRLRSLSIMLTAGLLLSVLSAIGPPTLTNPAAAATTCDGRAPTVDLSVAGQRPTDGDDVILGTPGPDRIVAGDGDDVICGGDGDDRIYAEGGDDRILGGAGDDLIRGGDGDDRIFGHSGADRLFGENGKDRISGNSGDDELGGGGADDVLWGGQGADRLDGGPLHDQLFGQAGDDSLYGRGGRDELVGDGGDDRLWGGDGHDRLDGGSDADELFGGRGNDWLWGGQGNDELRGHAGNDELNGGRGEDLVLGQDGDDQVNGNSGDDVVNGGAGTDSCDEAGTDCEFVPLTPEPFGSITGVVTADGGGVPIDGILVCATSSSTEPRCDNTNDAGRYTITELDTGNYKLVFTDRSHRFKRECYRNAAADCSDGTAVAVLASNATRDIDASLAPLRRHVEVSPPAPEPNPDRTAPIWINDQRREVPPWIRVDVHRATSLEVSWCCAADYETPDLAPVAFDIFVKPTALSSYELNQSLEVTLGSGSVTISTHGGSPLVEGEPYSVLIVAIDAAGNRSEGLERHDLIPYGPSTPTVPDDGGGSRTPDPAPSTPPPTVPVPEVWPLVQELPPLTIEDDPADSWDCHGAGYRVERTDDRIMVSWDRAPRGVTRYEASIVDRSTGRPVGGRQTLNVALVAFEGLRADHPYQVHIVARDSTDGVLGTCRPSVQTNDRPEAARPEPAPPPPSDVEPVAPTVRAAIEARYGAAFASYTTCHSRYRDYYINFETPGYPDGQPSADAQHYANFLCSYSQVYGDPEFQVCESCDSLRTLLDSKVRYVSESTDPVELTQEVWDNTWNPGSAWYEGCLAALSHPSNEGHDYCSPAARRAAGEMLLALTAGLGANKLLWPVSTGLVGAACAEFLHRSNARALCELFRLIPERGGR